MKFITAKIFSLMLLLCATIPALKADHYYNNTDRGDCCPSACYECGCNPLYCGAWDIQVHGGVAPIVWRQRDEFFAVDCNVIANPIRAFGEFPKFSHFYKVPWIVGGQIGHHLSENTRVYLEFNYSQAKAKRDVLIAAAPPVLVTPLLFNVSKYKVFDAYVGVRYYWDRWCDMVSFFLGGKIGVAHHKGVVVAAVNQAVPTEVFFPTDTVFFRKNTSVAGGLNLGLDFCFCGNFSFVITAEVVGNCGPRSVGVISRAGLPIVAPTNVLVGGISNELRFPITAGLRYSF